MRRRILQFTDIHISREGQLYGSIDTRTQFQQALDHAAPTKEDLLVISGDLAAHEGEADIYRWIRTLLKGYNCKKLFLAGNHDEPELMREFFTEGVLPHKHDYFGSIDFAEWKIIFLDSSSEWINDEQINWLKKHQQNQPTLLFVHHPPVSCSPYVMDNRYPMLNRDTTWPVISQVPGLKAVFCGHYHSEDHVRADGIDVFLTPSTAYQICSNVITRLQQMRRK